MDSGPFATEATGGGFGEATGGGFGEATGGRFGEATGGGFGEATGAGFGLVNPFTMRAKAAPGSPHACPAWCESWQCDGDEWCKDGSRPPSCDACPCPAWCYSWTCDASWCLEGRKPPVCEKCEKAAQALVLKAQAQLAKGPVSGAGPKAGWVVDHGKVQFEDSTMTMTGDSRAYLIEDYSMKSWADHKYVRLDLAADPLIFDLDLSGVPCGCLACVYVVAMKDPSGDKPNYCDMADNLAPGLHGGTCTELDFIEGNEMGMQSAIHTEPRGEFGSGKCNRFGCYQRSGINAPSGGFTQYVPHRSSSLGL